MQVIKSYHEILTNNLRRMQARWQEQLRVLEIQEEQVEELEEVLESEIESRKESISETELFYYDSSKATSELVLSRPSSVPDVETLAEQEALLSSEDQLDVISDTVPDSVTAESPQPSSTSSLPDVDETPIVSDEINALDLELTTSPSISPPPQRSSPSVLTTLSAVASATVQIQQSIPVLVSEQTISHDERQSEDSSTSERVSSPVTSPIKVGSPVGREDHDVVFAEVSDQRESTKERGGRKLPGTPPFSGTTSPKKPMLKYDTLFPELVFKDQNKVSLIGHDSLRLRSLRPAQEDPSSPCRASMQNVPQAGSLRSILIPSWNRKHCPLADLSHTSTVPEKPRIEFYPNFPGGSMRPEQGGAPDFCQQQTPDRYVGPTSSPTGNVEESVSVRDFHQVYGYTPAYDCVDSPDVNVSSNGVSTTSGAPGTSDDKKGYGVNKGRKVQK